MTEQVNFHVPMLVSAGQNGKLQELYDPEKSTRLFETHGQIGQVLSKIHTPKQRSVRLHQKYAYTSREEGKCGELQPFSNEWVGAAGRISWEVLGLHWSMLWVVAEVKEQAMQRVRLSAC